MTTATLFFKWEWLQMRVNTGLIFFGVWIVLTAGLCLVSRKKEIELCWKITSVNLAGCTLIGLLLYGFSRMQIVPAALLREGINRTDIPFGTINIVLLVITLGGFAAILAGDLLKKNK